MDTSTSDYYAILQLTPQADEQQIRQSYRALARKYHPDIAGEAGADMMRQLNIAYRVLSDPVRRQEYDRQRRYNVHFTPHVQDMPTAPAPPPFTPAPVPRSRPTAGRPQFSMSSGLYRLYRTYDTGTGAVASVAFAQNDALVGFGFNNGTVVLWHAATQQTLATLNLARERQGPTGNLHEIRLSPTGTYAMAWGLGLGTQIWNVLSGQTNASWSSHINSPLGLMDATLIDTPPVARMVLPNAPIALAEEDAFHWAEVGHGGSAVMTRPIAGNSPVAPAWAVPMICEESANPAAGTKLRIGMRFLCQEGQSLITFVIGGLGPRITNGSGFSLWNLRTPRNTLQRQNAVEIASRAFDYPITVANDQPIVAVQFESIVMRLYDLRSRNHVDVPTGQIPKDAKIALSPDGSLLAIALPEQRTVVLWGTVRGEMMQTWTVPAPLSSLRFGRQGRMPVLALGRVDGICELWAV